MGMLVNGSWTTDDGESRGSGGKFDHLPTKFRDVITADGSSGFKAEAGRYHLYCARGCPWAHRTIIFRFLKGLEGTVGLIFTGEPGEGMGAADEVPHTPPGTDTEITYLHQLYTLAKSDYTGRVTVPVLWDAKLRTVVNNESSEIIRMLNAEFGAFAKQPTDYYPDDLRDEIDAVNERVYADINNGVYVAGFSTVQEAYDQAYDNLFDALDWAEERLGRQRYLAGGRITEADWRLFPTLLRFDSVYHYVFKCNKKHLYEYPNLWNFTLELYQYPGVAEISMLDHFKRGYYSSAARNPAGTIPKGPELDFNQPHDRGRLPAAAA